MLVPRRAILVIAAVLLCACGARLDSDALAAATAQRTGGSDASAAAGRDAGTGAAGEGALAGSADGATGSGGAVRAGSSAGPTGAGGSTSPNPGDAPVVGAGEGACVPAGASEVGVTADSVTIGEVSTISGPIPGLGQTVVNGVRAYLAYLNATAGGVCGREVLLEVGDDRLDTGVNRSETQRLATRVLGFVGGWAVTDDGGASVLAGTNIPDVGLAISDGRQALETNFSSNPITPGSSGARTAMQYFIDTYGVTTAAVVWGAQVTARNSALKFVAELQSLGVDVVVQREVSVTETNYVPVAQEIENADAQMVMTALEITGISRLAQAFDQVDFLPTVPYYGAQTYGNRFLELAGPAAEGTLLAITHPILEERATNAEVALFEEWYQRVNPGAEIDFFSFQGWVSAAMFTDAIAAAGPSPTRDLVIDVLRTYTSYDAHGMVAPINPAEKRSGSCIMVVTVRNGTWERVHPTAGGFACF